MALTEDSETENSARYLPRLLVMNRTRESCTVILADLATSNRSNVSNFAHMGRGIHLGLVLKMR